MQHGYMDSRHCWDIIEPSEAFDKLRALQWYVWYFLAFEIHDSTRYTIYIYTTKYQNHHRYTTNIQYMYLYIYIYIDILYNGTIDIQHYTIINHPQKRELFSTSGNHHGMSHGSHHCSWRNHWTNPFFLHVFLASCSILELEAAISTVFATFWSWNLSFFHRICNMLVEFVTFWSWKLLFQRYLQHFWVRTVHVTW